MAGDPPLKDNPSAYVGVLTDRDDVALVLDPGTEKEERVCFAPLVALAIAAELVKYGQRQLARQAAALNRHEANTQARPLRLDS
jgi:hypothetical protein